MPKRLPARLPARFSARVTLSLFWRLWLFSMLLVALSLAAGILIWQHFSDQPGTALLLAGLLLALLGWIGLHSFWRPVAAALRALNGMVLSYRDGDYSGGLSWPRRDEIGQLVAAHNELGQALRSQRLNLVQRELLLDTMIQNTPVAMLLVADQGVIVFANLAARQLLNHGRKLEGFRFPAVLELASPSLQEAIQKGGDGLFTVRQGEQPDTFDEDQVYHLARSSFSLNGRQHELFLLRQLTDELRRQEVQSWKKLIRVISHELNNSLAPVSSLAGSGLELTRRAQYQRLPEILSTIAERTRHLERFIDGYARFAKLPAPRREQVQWPVFLQQLQAQIAFNIHLPDQPDSASFDPAQIAQALLNVLKNAHESSAESTTESSAESSADLAAAVQVDLYLKQTSAGWRIDILDNGSGMSEVVMANALIPFYSTKRDGTGLGLALVREIIEAHGGWMALNNRSGGGLQVSLILPT